MFAIDIAPLTECIDGLVVDSLGGQVPVQSTGTLAGMPFYFHARSGVAYLHVGGDVFWAPLYRSQVDYGELYVAFDLAQFVPVFCRLVAMLERSPRLWEFANAAGQKFGAWGMTPEEAWARMFEPNDYVSEKLAAQGYDLARQIQWVHDRGMNETTITIDDRVWPDPALRFVVKDPADV